MSIERCEIEAMDVLVWICESYRTPEELMYLAREFELAAFRQGWNRTVHGAMPRALERPGPRPGSKHPRTSNPPTFNQAKGA